MRTESPTDADTGDEPVTSTDPAEAGRPRRRLRAATVLPWVLVVLAVAVAVVSTWRWQQLAGEERQRVAVQTAAEDFAVELTNWDAADGMADTRDALVDNGTEAFGQDVEQLFGGTEDLAALADVGASSEGHVRGVYVQWIGEPPADEAAESTDADAPPRAEALAVITQRLITDAGQETTARYARIVLEDSDEGWLIHEVELLVDASQATTATPGGAEGSPGAAEGTPGAAGDASSEAEG